MSSTVVTRRTSTAAPEDLSDHKIVQARRIIGHIEDHLRESAALYEPLPAQLAFHKSQAIERLAVGSNQAGKSLCGIMEVVWAATGTHPYISYPRRDGKIYIVGKDEQHLADPLYEKLCAPGAFEIIRDEQTQLWRAYRPWTDAARAMEKRPAEPLLPARLIDSISWRLKKGNTPKCITLKNGYRLMFYPSSAKPKQGTQVHLVLFDEEIVDSTWYPECALRLMRYGGRFIWTATPHTSSQGLLDLADRAETERAKPKPAVTLNRLLIVDNPYISEANKLAMRAKLTSPDDILIRWEGVFATAGFLVYPEFHMKTHGCESFEIPKDWTRYMVVDPGYQTACALFFAVPPVDPSIPQHVYLYDEIYANNCDANRFGELAAAKVQQDSFWEFVIDNHAAQMTPMSGGYTIGEQYQRALKRFNVSSIRTGNSFVAGVDNVKAGNLAVHDWLYNRPIEGTPRLQVFRGRCPNFEHEIARYRKKQDKKTKTYLDDPEQRRNHAMDALRYARGRDFQWHFIPIRMRYRETSYERFKKYFAHQSQPGSGYVNLGPGDAA